LARVRVVGFDDEVEGAVFFFREDGSYGCVGAEDELVVEVKADLDVLTGF